MKKYLFILLLIVLQKFLFAQQYQPFPDSNAVWSIAICGGGPPVQCWTYYYCLKGDTVINTFTYHKLNSSDSTCTTITPIGGFRENNKKIYFLCFSDAPGFICYTQQEQILYDFNANIGDTVHYGTSGHFIVNAIDSIQLLNGQYRKRYCYFSATCTPDPIEPSVIEGIGNTTQLLTGDWYYNRLLCFKQNDTLLYINTNFNTCYVNNVSVAENDNNFFSYSFIPNPITEYGKLVFNSSIKNIGIIKVYDCLGNKIKEISSSEGQYIIVRKDFAPGFYIFSIIGKDNLTIGSGKFIIQ